MRKITFSLIVMMMLPLLLYAQQKDIPNKFSAVSEKAVYKLYEQMLDSAIVLNASPISNYFQEIENSDTIIKFEQYCYWYRGENFVCDRNIYDAYISNKMSIVFYEKFLNYLKNLGNNDNIFYKYYSRYPLRTIRNILIKQYESQELNNKDKEKAFQLIDETSLRLIKDAHWYYFIINQDEKYMTGNVRQALIEVIDNPFYPTLYLDYYISQQDTMSVDTVGISNEMKKKYDRGMLYSGEYYDRLSNFYYYEKMGKMMGGISAAQTYLNFKIMDFYENNYLDAYGTKSKLIIDKFDNGDLQLFENKIKFYKKGYLSINTIAEYAHKKQDKLLIKHLKEFKKKYPDYPLKYF